MGIKTLSIATLGLLKQGAKRALSIATEGLIHVDLRRGKPLAPPVVPSGHPLSVDINVIEANNVALLIALDNVI